MVMSLTLMLGHPRVDMEDIEEIAGMVSSLQIFDTEQAIVDDLLAPSDPPDWSGDGSFDERLSDRVADGDFMMSIGSVST